MKKRHNPAGRADIFTVYGTRAVELSVIAVAEQVDPGNYFVSGYMIEPRADSEPLPFPLKIEPLIDRTEAVMTAGAMLELGKSLCCPHHEVTYCVQRNTTGLLVIRGYVATRHNHHARLLYTVMLTYKDPDDEFWQLSCLSRPALMPDGEPDPALFIQK